MIPNQPINLLPEPFAQNGTKAIVPDQKPNPGRASFSLGFPDETQLPMNMGGIAPNRMDFNGMFYMLSAFAFWQQSGGMFSFQPALNYQPPALVFHAAKLWWCVAPNGPETAAGEVLPGTDENYWMEFLKALGQMGGGGDAGAGIPVGGYVYGRWTVAPDGFFECNGQAYDTKQYPKLFALLGVPNVPDYKGLFLRSTGGAAKVQGLIQPATLGPHAHKIPGRAPSTGSGKQGLHHDSDVEYDVGVERYTTTGSTTTTGAGIGTETAPAHVAEMLCIRHD